MNYTTALFLVNDNLRAIRATYEDRGTAELFKTFDPTIKKDDIIAVSSTTRHNITICKVTEVDIVVDVESSEPAKWALARIDIATYENIIKQEAFTIEHIKLAEAQQKRDELKAKMGNYFANVKPLELASAVSTDAKE